MRDIPSHKHGSLLSARICDRSADNDAACDNHKCHSKHRDDNGRERREYRADKSFLLQCFAQQFDATTQIRNAG